MPPLRGYARLTAMILALTVSSIVVVVTLIVIALAYLLNRLNS